MPFLAGFYSRNFILETFSMRYVNMFGFFLLFVSTGLTVCYSFRLFYFFYVVSFSHFLYATQAPRVSRGIVLLFSRTFGTRWGGRVSPTPRPPLPPGKTRYPLYRKLGGPKGRSERAEKLVPNVTRSRTVQAAVSRYID